MSYLDSSPQSICVVFLTDEKYFDKFLFTCHQLINRGKYGGGSEPATSHTARDICVIVDKKLHDADIYNHPFILENKILVKYFPAIEFSAEFHEMARIRGDYNKDKCRYDKLIQYQKIFVFDSFFKKWNYVLYMDGEMNINYPIQPILDILCPDCFYAHSDSYHTYEWNLERQFITENQAHDKYLAKLKKNFDPNIDYFQTTIFMFDTRRFIKPNVVSDLISLAEEFPNCWTNEQGIMSVYFSKVWKQIPFCVPGQPYIRLYDYMNRFAECKYIMYKRDFGIRMNISVDPVMNGKWDGAAAAGFVPRGAPAAARENTGKKFLM
jgi:hypothetical protein